MADVKISKLVASTARYARKAATTADKNKNKRLTRTEAKKLPKDLRDDFGRQVKNGASVGVAAFASDQAAYVARAARAADGNHDGVLSAAEQGRLPKTLKDNVANFAAGNAAGAPALTTVPVSSTLSARVVALGGSGQHYAAQFKAKGSELAKVLANPEANKAFFNDLLFRATGTSYQHDYPDYYSPAGLTLGPITQAAAVTDMVDNILEVDAMTRAELTAKVKAVVSSVAGTSGAKVMRLGWTNHDDASFDGVFAFDTRTGQVRAAGWYNEP